MSSISFPASKDQTEEAPLLITRSMRKRDIVRHLGRRVIRVGGVSDVIISHHYNDTIDYSLVSETYEGIQVSSKLRAVFSYTNNILRYT